MKNWDDELKKMNKSKNGRPYRYPETFIQFCGLTGTPSSFAISPA